MGTRTLGGWRWLLVLPALLVALGAAGCATVVPVEAPEGGALQDVEVAQRVADRLSQDLYLERAAITVSCDEGVVTLRGVVRDQTQRVRAVGVARGAAGVAGVIDSLRVF